MQIDVPFILFLQCYKCLSNFETIKKQINYFYIISHLLAERLSNKKYAFYLTNDFIDIQKIVVK